MKILSKLFVTGSLLASSAALAGGGKPFPGTDHQPPRFVDETSTVVSIHPRGNRGYGMYVQAWVQGFTSTSDTFRLDWKQNGKVLASGACKSSKVADNEAAVTCELDDKPIKAKGVVDAELIYIDDQDSKEYLVRDYKVTVAQYASAGDEVWQIVPDDLLAAGYVKHWVSKDSRGGRPNFILWTATRGEGHDLVLRCNVDGTKLDDLKASMSSAARVPQSISATVHTKASVETQYAWEHTAIVPANLMYGEKDASANGRVWLIDHPGKWMCEVRTDAHPIRELRFTVNDKGMIDSDELQTGKGAAPLFDGVAAIDLRIPKDSTFDLRVRPDAMKKSRGFGLAWPEHANVKAILAALPPSRGLPDPK